MSNLHAYYALKDEQAFSKVLEASKARKQVSTPSSSPGKTPALDVNAKDWLGRTVLHLACSNLEPYALTYIRMLLAHPLINVNVQDAESKWTPLHRALYQGNLSACQLLLKRPDIDTQIRDNEGLTSFDLYNLTIEGTWPLKPGPSLPGQDYMRDLNLSGDLFTWGGNRNATLGHGDSNDRTFPDHVRIPRLDNPTGINKFILLQAKAASMAKLHTAALTNESGQNLRVCGFGSGGRLGSTKHTLYTLQHLPQLPYPITSVAAAQDHTLTSTSRGEVWSWGLNRFSQLGYAIDSSGLGHASGKTSDEPIQAIPRRVIGPLKKEIVIGVAASKIASACWTANEGDVYTWGTNTGQLGYDSSMQPIQILPRKVTGVQSVIGIALIDTAMACLLDTRDVICFHDNIRSRVKFSISDPSDLPPYIPPFASKPPIVKITGCEGVFAALSTRGDVWSFSLPGRLQAESSKDLIKNKDRVAVKPQRVWTVRRSVDPARDVALGADGDIIVCTEPGHVFIRSRTANNPPRSTAKATAITKGAFHRVPLINRAIFVYANSAGAFGALRLNYSPRPIIIEGNTLSEDITTVRPWAPKVRELEIKSGETHNVVRDNFECDNEEAINLSSVKSARGLIALLSADADSCKETKRGLFTGKLEFGADMIIRTEMDIPVHRALLSARSPMLRRTFGSHAHNRQSFADGSTFIQCIYSEENSSTGLPILVIIGVHSLAVLLLLEFFYTDIIPILDTLQFNDAVQIRREVNQLATIFEIADLLVAGDTGIAVRSSTLGNHLCAIFKACQNDDGQPIPRAIRPDVFINLMDRKVACHSVLLRSRCLFFKYFFEEDVWTMNRWTPDRTISINMQHMEWRGFSYVMNWIYGGEEDTLFNNLDVIDTLQDFINLVFEVISIASELLLDRLTLVCSTVLLQFVTLTNAPSLLARATHYNALSIVTSLQDYIACNLEAILESRLLDNNREREYDVEALIPALGTFIRCRQAEFSPLVRSGLAIDEIMERHAAWLQLQDLPSPIIRNLHPSHEQQSPRQPQVTSVGEVLPGLGSEDCMFPMDETAMSNRTSLSSQSQVQSRSSISREISSGVWKAKKIQDIPKVDFKTVMAETAAQATSVTNAGEKRRLAGLHRMHSAGLISISPPLSLSAHSHRTSGTLPWNVPVQRPSTVASPISVSALKPPSRPVPAHGLRSTVAISSPKSSVKAEHTPSIPMTNATLPPSSPSLKSPSIIRRATNDSPAWIAKPPNQDLSPPVAGLSFTDIQQQQLAQTRSSKGKQSLREIQEEEHAKREEEEFLKWWADEEKRVKQETMSRLKDASNSQGISMNNRNRRSKRSERRFTQISKDNPQ